ncbi:hypothetical protein N7470_007571 [Penicillium chermesinum]|nr:hypothetical protein N7470_007571 [Penicillium chermesinum]
MTEADETSEDDRSSPFKATLDLPVALPSPTKVYFQQPVDVGFPAALTPPTSIDEHKAELDQTAARDVHVLSYLPPVNLHIELPDGYPSEKPPRVQLNTQPPWLPAPILAKLSNDCERLWKECGQDMVVFTYIDHLQQLAETAFGIQDTNDGELYLARDLKIPLLDFNRDVDSVKCLAPDCDKNQHPTPAPGSEVQTPRRKKDRTIGPSELLQIPLSTETVQRYVFLKRKKKIEADTNTVYCPRHWCQGAARSKRHPKPQDPMEDDDGSDDDEASPTEPNGKVDEAPSRENRLAICEDCNYAFCAICKKGWHGDLVFCVPRLQAEPTEEEKATEEYFRLYTTHCPTCNVPCQKLMGCNHMRCVKCDTHFCYLCSAWLSPDNPYRHFNEEGRYCYNRLWDLEGGDGENPIGADALHNIFEVDSDDDAPNELFWDLHSSDEEPEPEAEPPRRRHRAPPPAPIPPRPNAAARDAEERVMRAVEVERRAHRNAIAGMQDREQPVPPPPLQVEDWQQGLQRFLHPRPR